MRYGSIALAVTVLLSVGAVVPSATAQTIEDRGLRVLHRACGRCHSVDRASPSGHLKAPPFREIATRYPPENLAESLAEGIVSGHPDMPVVSFEPADIGAIIAFLTMLRDPPKQP